MERYGDEDYKGKVKEGSNALFQSKHVASEREPTSAEKAKTDGYLH